MLKKALPYVIAAAALYWLFRTTDRAALAAAFARASLVRFVLVGAVFQVAICAADTFAMSRVFGWFQVGAPYRDLFVVRAATYLLAVINYHVGQAAIVGYLTRVRGVPVFRASGYILFIVLINVGTLFVLASGGATRAPENLAFLRWMPLATAGGAAFWALVLTVKPRLLAERELLAPLFEMGVAGHLKALAVRLPHVSLLVLWNLFALRTFGIAVPVIDALIFLPIYFATASLPVNINGLGVAQLVAVAFFAPYAEGVTGDAAQRAAVAAYSLGTSVTSIGLQVTMGLLFLRAGTNTMKRD